MRYLLDVNVLLALAYPEHVHHQRVFAWLNTLHGSELATCAITELGFVRIASGRVAFASNVDSAKSDLMRLKGYCDFVFVANNRSVEYLPEWVEKSNQTTNGHLLELAASRGARLVTLDRGIPGADLIPELSGGTLVVRDRWSRRRIIDPDTSDALGDPPYEEMRSRDAYATAKRGVTPQS